MAIESAQSGIDPSVSGDGRRIVFTASASSIPSGLPAAPDAVWLRDRVTGELVELTIAGNGLRPGASRHPVISRDGCTVAMVTEVAFDLFRDDDLGDRWDVYRTVLPGCPGEFARGEWQLVSTTAVGEPIARGDVAADQSPAVAGSGSVIAYARRAVPDGGEIATWTSLDVVDLAVPLGTAGRVTTAPGLPFELPSSDLAVVGQREPAISDDGTFVSFTTDAVISDVLDADTGEETILAAWPKAPAATSTVISPDTQVYRWNRDVSADSGDLTFQLVSATAAGDPAAGSSGRSSISQQGDVVAFVSTDPDLDSTTAQLPRPAGFRRDMTQVYVADLDPEAPPVEPGQPVPEVPERVLTMASRTGTAIGNGPSRMPALDGDGHAVAFITSADNLSPLDPRSNIGDGGDLMVTNLVDGTVERITVRPDGSPTDAGAADPAMSASGRSIVFTSAVAGQLVDTPAPAGLQVVRVERFPQIDVTPVDVGTVAIGLPSPEWRTTIVNRGPGALVPDTITTSDPAFALTGGTCFARSPIPAGSSCELHVVFTPIADGPASSEITLAEDGFGALGVTTVISGTGGVPTLVADPGGQSLGTAVVGARADTTGSISVANVGPFDERIVAISTSGADSRDFRIEVDNCTDAIVPPGQVCDIGVGFRPSADGPRHATITVTSEGGATTSAVVYGKGYYAPGIAVGVSTVKAGDSVVVGGLGFPASARLNVSWSDTEQSLTVVASDNGAFSVRLPVLAGSASGPRKVMVIDAANRFDPVESGSIRVTSGQHTSRRRP